MTLRIATATLHRQAAQSIQAQQSRLSELQNELARGLKLNRGADDPAGMAAVTRLDDALAGLDRDRSNVTTLERRLGIEESTLGQVTETLQRVRELTLQGANASQSPESRRQIAVELEARLDELVALANTGDGSGRHLFGGTRDAQPPFSLAGSSVNYAGDDQARRLEIGNNRQLRDSDPGSEVFLRVPSGNGSFRVTAGGNSGTATLTGSQLLDPAAFDGQTYTLSFNAGQYSVSDADGATVASGEYQSGEAISFAGVSLTLTGTPADGDSFSVAPSGNQSIFESVRQLAAALADPDDDPAADARRQVALQTGLDDLDQALGHIGSVRGDVGARLSVLEQTRAQIDGVEIELQRSVSELRDLDYAEATTRLAMQLTGLEAAQQSYLRVQNLSLFRLLG